MLLLYDSVSIYGVSPVPDLSELNDLGLVEVISDWDDYRNAQFDLLGSTEREALLQALSFALGLDRIHGSVVDGTILKLFDDCPRRSEFLESVRLFIRRSMRYGFLPGTQVYRFRSMEEIDLVLDLVLNRGAGESYRSATYGGRIDREGAAAVSLAIATIWEATVRLQGLLELSAKRGQPIVTSAIEVRGRGSRLGSARESGYHQAFAILLSGLHLFPKVDTIEDVLRLREDSRIVNMREVLVEWGEGLRSGELDASRLHRRMEAAARDLSKLERLRKVGRWWTYASIPVSLASAIAGVPAGLALAPLGLAVRVGSDVAERRLRWMMVGR